MKQRMALIFCGIVILGLVTGGYYPAWAAEPVTPKEDNVPATGSMVSGVSFDAEFYRPQGSAKKVGVLVLGGSDGGVPSRRAKLLADNGFPALAVGYFKTARTPAYLDMIPLEYFDEPIEWLLNSEYTQGGAIVITGESKGAELALLLASRKAELSGVIAFVPGAVVFQGIPKDYSSPRSSWSYAGEPVPFVPYDFRNLKDPNNPLSIYTNSLKQTEAVEKARIPVNNINGPILLLSAAEDGMWPSVALSEMIVRSLQEGGFPHPYEHVTYEHAGHTMTEYFMMGGDAEGNRKARIESTEKMLAFLDQLAAE